jgi:hypothetical protein
MKTLKFSLSVVLFLFIAGWLQAQTTVGPFTFTPTNSGGTMQGQAQINGIPSVAGDIIAAFRPNGMCVGAAPLTIYQGVGYINFVIYGDDNTGNDNGMLPGELFYLKLYDASEDLIIEYGEGLSSWSNTNFAPMPGFNNPSVVYNFLSASLSVEPANRSVSSAAGSTTFTITSNTTWTVSDNAAWLTVSPVSGSNNGTITAYFTQNTNPANRVATITITGAGITNPETVTVTQSSPKNLSISPRERKVSSTSGSTTFTLTSNTNWTVSDNVSWLAVSPASGSSNSTLTAVYSSNSSSSIRSARIIAVGEDVPNDTVWVRQYPIIRTLTVGSQDPSGGVPITVSPADTSGGTNGVTQFTRRYFNNTSVTLTAPPTASSNLFEKWLKNGIDFSTNQSITFNILANANYTAVYKQPDDVIITIPDTTVLQNTVLELPVYVSDVTGKGIISFQFDITFDQTVIVPADPFVITTGTLSGTADWTVMANPNNPGQLTVGGFGTNSLAGAGKLIKLKFDAIGDLGTQSPVNFTSFEFNDGNPPVTLINGSVTIQPKVCGDADENGVVQAYDAALALQHAIGLIILPPQGEINADVNEDGVVTAFDAALILRHAIGLPMPAGIETCFDVKNGFADELPESYKFNAKINKLDHSELTTTAEINLYGIEELGKVYAVSFDVVSPWASIQNFSMLDLPDGYIMYSNPVSATTSRIAIINPYGVLTKDMSIILRLNSLQDGAHIVISNIILNDQNIPDITLTGNKTFTRLHDERLKAFPNPFNTSTTIEYLVDEDSFVKLVILDQLGRTIKTLVSQNQETGYYSIIWNGENANGATMKQGWYIIKLTSNASVDQIKVNLIY